VGNLTNIVYSGGPATSPISLRYDALNRLTNMVDGIGVTSFGWTNGVLLTSEDGPWSRDRVDIISTPTACAAAWRSSRKTPAITGSGPWCQGAEGKQSNVQRFKN
jgi:hypothetical protein